MDAISAEALGSLTSAILSLLPQPADASLTPSITVQATSITPAGIGGFVAVHHGPEGEIVGRRVDAAVVVGLLAAEGAIAATVANAINSVLAAERSILLDKGILKVSMERVGDRSPAAGGAVAQPVTFRVLFEYLKNPADPEGTIQQIPLNIQLQQ